MAFPTQVRPEQNGGPASAILLWPKRRLYNDRNSSIRKLGMFSETCPSLAHLPQLGQKNSENKKRETCATQLAELSPERGYRGKRGN